jgi:hypothetical protein
METQLMSKIMVPDDYLAKNFQITWPDVFSGLIYNWLSPSFAIDKAKSELKGLANKPTCLANLAKANYSDKEYLIDCVRGIILDFKLDDFDEEEITNKHHYIVMKYIYDSPEVFPDQLQAAQEYSEEWLYPPEISLFTSPYVSKEFYPGDAEDVKKQTFKYWKQYLDETKEEYGWRTFKDFLKHEGISSS